MVQNPETNTNRGYFISIGAALLGGALGGVFAAWLWLGTPTLSIDDIILLSVLGIFVGVFPGWFAGLLCRLILENRFQGMPNGLLPPLVAFSAAFLISGIIAIEFLSRLAID